MIGMVGIICNRKNIILILLSVELMLVGVNMSYLMYAVYLDDIMGKVMGIFILTVAAAESAIGLGILVGYFRVRGEIRMSGVRLMQG